MVMTKMYATAVLATLVSTVAIATEVALAGLFGNKAVLVINGAPPHTIQIGQSTREGLKLIATSPSARSAIVEVDGVTRTLFLGQSPVHVKGGKEKPAAILYGDSRGHHFAQGSVNGLPVRFLVDTGASMISMGIVDAGRAGIDYRKGTTRQVQTASGQSTVWQVNLTSVQIGNVTLHGVDALVFENELPFVLLGMSALNRMDMEREGNRLILRKKY